MTVTERETIIRVRLSGIKVLPVVLEELLSDPQ